MTSRNSAIPKRYIFEIAKEIRDDWKAPYFGAVPYIDAMSTLNTIDDNYIADTARTTVVYFLANASTWKGDTARRVKLELRSML